MATSINLDCKNLRCRQLSVYCCTLECLLVPKKSIVGLDHEFHLVITAQKITHDTYRFPHRPARIRLLREPLNLQPPRKVPSVAEEKGAPIQMRLDQRKQIRFHRM